MTKCPNLAICEFETKPGSRLYLCPKHREQAARADLDAVVIGLDDDEELPCDWED